MSEHNPSTEKHLSKRERQILDALYQLDGGSVQDVLEAIDNPPSYSSVRALLNRMVEKQQIRAERDGNRYRYFPLDNKKAAGASAMKRLVETFFGGSAVDAVKALLGNNKNTLTQEELAVLEKEIDKLKD
ncbi:BlaI/MecI/CopY family transcriptional regulator [Sessilibacter sp. MAH1]